MTRSSNQELPRICRTLRQLAAAIGPIRAAGKKLGLVPTMGALHEGHLSLVRAAQEQCDETFVTIFVNPSQFGPGEDFREYPRNLDEDLASLGALGVRNVFVPEVEVLYPPGFSTYVDPPDVARPLEGACRPGHFRGVATIVLKLFHLIPADLAYFGEKDYQQCLVIRRMVEDLDLPVVIRTCPIVREPDGLAMSSRNRYLDHEQRSRSLALWRSLCAAQELVARGARDVSALTGEMQRVMRAAGVERIDYTAVVHPETLASLRQIDGPARALVAARIGDTRLIDNCSLS